MKGVFYFVTIFILCSAFTEAPNYTTDETTFSTDETIELEYVDYNDTLDYNGTTDSTTYYTGESPITTLSTRSTSTKSTSTVRPTFDTPRTTLLDRYKFESVDYNDLPANLKTYHSDCYGQHIRCIRHRTDHNQVCGFNTHTRYYDDYYSPCEIELQNCLYRVKKGFGVFGTNYTNDVIFYNGEGLDCIYYLRRAKNMEEMHKLYFGGDDDDDETDY